MGNGASGPQKISVLPQPAAVETVIGDDLGNAAPEFAPHDPHLLLAAVILTETGR